jgi:SAM-dependent methyltransferase
MEQEMNKVRDWEGHSGKLIESKNGFEVIECSCCEFKHTIPIPSEKELREIYSNEYYTTEKPLYIERNLEDQEWWRVVYDARLNLFEKLLPQDRREILEIGSGPGFFLKRAIQRGWSGIGFEPSTKAADHARGLGLEIRNEFLSEDAAADLKSFDVIYLNEVLEHIPKPLEMLQLAERLLAPGGLLCVIVPNDYNPLQQALRRVSDFPSWWVAPPHHINYFDVSSIKGLVRKTGTRIVNTEATFPIDLFLLMGDNYVGNDELGRQCHGKRKTLEINLEKAGLSEMKRSLYQFLAEQGIGREIQVVGQKPL